MVEFMSPYASRPTGGDYSTMVVDARGLFHPMWPDARDGAYQLYTSTIRILPADTSSQPVPLGSLHGCSLNSEIRLLAGASSWNAAAKEAIIPVQLENLSRETLFHPLSVQVTVKGAPFLKDNPFALSMKAAYPLPKILDPITGSYATTAKVVYPVSFVHPLFPRGVTVSKLWSIRFNQPEQVYVINSLRVMITGLASSCR
jgi:hypothetical protein